MLMLCFSIGTVGIFISSAEDFHGGRETIDGYALRVGTW